MQVASGDPVKDETSDAIICGTSAKTATGTAKVNPGDSLQIYWSNEGGGNWIHNVGQPSPSHFPAPNNVADLVNMTARHFVFVSK